MARFVTPFAAFSLRPAAISPQDWDGTTWVTVGDLVVTVGDTLEWRVPAGTPTDGASIPWWARSLFSPFGGRAIRAAVVHDWAYDHLDEFGCGRSGADDLFRALMRSDGVGWARSWIMWAAVRLAGWRFAK